ncbi:NADP-dependent oxidoreductase domain-containing protein [Cyathus striatus]|nr:NADP-dependent oxidoreductase domain-containing protein [Cyathus striatus]
MVVTRKLTLNNGVEIPIIGTGAWAPSDPESQGRVTGWILSALKNGFRHIDTARGYLTEKAVGQAVRESGIPREEIFITTKLPWGDHNRVRESFEESFNDLGLDYIDLYLIHWPQYIDDNNSHNPDGTWRTIDSTNFNESWAEVEKLLDTGKVRSIGVSNFSIKTLDQLFKTAKVTPAVNQVEMHPYLAQNDLRAYCKEKGIAITAYTPSGYSIVRNDPLLIELSKKYGCTPNQLTLAWHLTRDTIIVPKSENPERQKENINLPTLDPEDIEKISKLDRNQRICNKADANGQVYGWTYEQLGW